MKRYEQLTAKTLLEEHKSNKLDNAVKDALVAYIDHRSPLLTTISTMANKHSVTKKELESEMRRVVPKGYIEWRQRKHKRNISAFATREAAYPWR